MEVGKPVAEPLSQNDVSVSGQEKLARKFNPCMVFAGPDLWPVEVSYIWSQGAPLMRVTLNEKGEKVKEEVWLTGQKLSSTNWSALPAQENGKNYAYYVDGPGDNLGPGKDETTWMEEFRKTQKNMKDPAKAVFPPTQYVHLFWYDKEKALLSIQYWFYYPYDKWVNNHEGDWEHVNVVLQLSGEGGAKFDPDSGNQTPVAYQFFFHGFSAQFFKEVTRAADKNSKGGDHLVVFVGGDGTSLWVPGWTGLYSGGSYPAAGRFYIAGFTDDTTKPARFLHANDIWLIVLPEPGEADYNKYPELSWFNVNFYAGQWVVEQNAKIVKKVKGNDPPTHPGRKGSWNGGLGNNWWLKNAQSSFTSVSFPENWILLYRPEF